MEKNSDNFIKDPWGALVLITIGVVFLLNNFGVLPWDVWLVLWRFWPILLIMSGVEMIIPDTKWGRFLVLLIGAVVVGVLFSYLFNNRNSYSSDNFEKQIKDFLENEVINDKQLNSKFW